MTKGHVMVTFRNFNTVFSDKPGSVYNMTMGECR